MYSLPIMELVITTRQHNTQGDFLTLFGFSSGQITIFMVSGIYRVLVRLRGSARTPSYSCTPSSASRPKPLQKFKGQRSYETKKSYSAQRQHKFQSLSYYSCI